MDFLNKFGQRNIAKYLVFGSIAISLIIFTLKLIGFAGATKPSVIAIILGTAIFSAPNLLLSITAHKSKIYRLISLFSSSVILGLNTLLFILGLYYPQMSFFLFIVSVIEIVLAAVFLKIAINAEKNKEIKEEKTRTIKTKSIKDNTKEINANE